MEDAEEELRVHRKECDYIKSRLDKTREDVKKIEIEIAGYPTIDIDIIKIEKQLKTASG